jgi:hypothetical protein
MSAYILTTIAKADIFDSCFYIRMPLIEIVPGHRISVRLQ